MTIRQFFGNIFEFFVIAMSQFYGRLNYYFTLMFEQLSVYYQIFLSNFTRFYYSSILPALIPLFEGVKYYSLIIWNGTYPYLISAYNKTASYIPVFQDNYFYTLLILIVGIGTVNWTIWIIRRTRSVFYENIKGEYNASTSVIVPIYKEDPRILRETIDSILKNNPSELILMFDHSETENMIMVNEVYNSNKIIKAYAVYKPGKRPALAEGIRRATGEIIVLVDSDTQWASKNFLKHLLAPFKIPKVGGVGTRQQVKNKKTWAQRIIDWMLDIKYTDYISSDSLSGSVLCLSGRTAAYRREAVLHVVDKLENEYFLWHKCLGGDDARLTSLVLEQGYKTVYQDICLAKSDFHPSMFIYLKQKVRWSRNSFRTYLKTLTKAWPWKQKRLYYVMATYHTLIPGLTLLIGLIFMIYSAFIGAWAFVILFASWMFISRAIKSYSHLRKEPKDILLLPVVIIYFYILSFIKLYALFTMTHESWSGSRDNYRIKDRKRLSKKQVQVIRVWPHKGKEKIPLTTEMH